MKPALFFSLLLSLSCAPVADDAALSFEDTSFPDDFSSSLVSPLPPDVAVLSWEPSSLSVDGTFLDEPAGYRVYRLSGDSLSSFDVGPALSFAFDALPKGSHLFWVTAYDSSGNESSPSDLVTKSVE